MGTEIMAQLAEGYEDICEMALPSTAHDALVDAYDTNLMYYANNDMCFGFNKMATAMIESLRRYAWGKLSFY
ncbi:hypothetical protein Bca52824_024930 [Brassica carinata]|uniref:Uncharacterized protein n=1 Tax=Brassica carinata TaxID=52824 RepID=A0A8X8AWB8_BRACI|nr:hypothetical protein Bca52824_024930 [Brassica carinata]